MNFTPSRYQGPSLLDGTEFEGDAEDARRFYSFTIEWRGVGHPDKSASSWAICSPGWVYNRAGEQDMEPQPSSRTDEWKKDHRFTFDEACEIILINWSKWQAEVLKVLRPRPKTL